MDDRVTTDIPPTSGKTMNFRGLKLMTFWVYHTFGTILFGAARMVAEPHVYGRTLGGFVESL